MFKTLRRSKAEYAAALALIIPIVFQNLASSSLGLADTLMVGVLGQNELAGLNQANVVFFVLQTFIFGIQSGGAVLISQYWGKKDLGAINRVMGMSIYTALGFTLLTSTVIFFFPEAVMGLTTNDPAIIDCAARYAKIVAFSFVINSVTLVYVSTQRNMENSSIGMNVLVTSMAVNIFLNWVLMFGKFGAPALGLEGAAYATVISRVVEAAIVAVYIAFVDKRLPIMPKKLFKPGKMIALDYIRYATPVVINEILWSVAYSLYAVIYGHMSGASDIIAAYSIVSNLERTVLVLCQGLGCAAAVLIGKAIGEGRSREEVQSVGDWQLSLSVVTGLFSCGLLLAVRYLLLDSVILNIFTMSENAAVICRMMIVAFSVRVIFKNYNMVSIVGVLRGGGNVRAAMIVDVVFMYFWSIPVCALAAFAFDASITTVVVLAMTEDVIKAIVSGVMVKRGNWIKDLTRSNF